MRTPLSRQASHAAPKPQRAARRRGARILAFARVVAAALAVLAALAPRVAHAGPTVTIANKSPKEDDGRWKLKMTINYGTLPHLAHIPMVFEFTPTMHYERALTDQSPEKPVLNRIPLHNQQSINESMDVGFSDGTGKIFKITKFDFVLRRDRGFEAGEYELKIRRTLDGVQMGQTQRITLQGDNPIIDRRAIVFAGEKKPKKKEGGDAEKRGDSEKAGGEEPESEASPDETPPDDMPLDDNAPPEVPPKQGGCGCRVAEDVAGSPAPWLAALALGALAARRRRAPARPARA